MQTYVGKHTYDVVPYIIRKLCFILTKMLPKMFHACSVEVIGVYASDEEPALSEAERRQGEEGLRRLLVGAPADRAWRRRGCMVLCRNRILTSSGKPLDTDEDVCLDAEEREVQEGHEDEQQRRRERECTDGGGKYHPAAKVARVAGGEGGGSSTATPADAVVDSTKNQLGRVEIGGQEDGSDRDCFADVCFRLVELAEEEIFREIVGFL